MDVTNSAGGNSGKRGSGGHNVVQANNFLVGKMSNNSVLREYSNEVLPTPTS